MLQASARGQWSGCPAVVSKQPAEALVADNLADRSFLWSAVDQLFPEALVVPFPMELSEVLVEDVPQVTLAEQDHAVEALLRATSADVLDCR